MPAKYQAVVIVEGETDEDAEPVVLSDDPEILAAVWDAISRRRGAVPAPAPPTPNGGRA